MVSSVPRCSSPPRFRVSRLVAVSFFMGTMLSCGLVSAEDCVKLSDCSFICSGITYDLSDIGDQTGQPKFKDVQALFDEYSYSYNPCYPFTETDPGAYPDECQDVASCQVIAGGPTQYYDCGKQSSVVFQRMPGNEISSLIESTDQYLVATYGQDGQGRMTKAVFGCGDEKFSALGEDPTTPTKYIYMLSSPTVCVGPQGISVGSILLIIFFVLIVVYFVGGIILMKFYRGASGPEMIPNRAFWTALPGLIKDGVLFLTSKCRPKTVQYDKI